ncbi:hypothetical protein M0802_006969 [Mischocyttarus mexicanus]|nr:hypothetical protein M0802_006969 [Mischocyttarus mexicanus]
MNLYCRIKVYDRAINVPYSFQEKNLQNGCLVIGLKNNEAYILLQTKKNPCGTKYKVNNNIEMIFEKSIEKGKVVIRIKEPPHDFYLQGDPMQLKCFIRVVKLTLSNKVSLRTITTSKLNTKKMFNIPVTKIVIKNKFEYPTLNGFPIFTKELHIVGIDRKSLDPQILRLCNLKVLNLSYNQIKSLPKDLGKLPFLQELNLSNNRLSETSKWDWLEQDNIRNNLCLLDLTSNLLSRVPENIVNLNNLVNLKLGMNSIVVLPQSMRKLTSLRYLDISNNRLQYLPGGLRKLQLSEINIYQNDFTVDFKHEFQNNILVLSLVDYAATAFLKTSRSYDASMLPRTLVKYLDSAIFCSCGKACFKSYVKDIIRYKFDVNVCIVRSSDNSLIPFECYFCSLPCYDRYKHRYS